MPLEESSSVGEESGWLPCHLTLWEKKQLQGAVCLYEKYNGYGEYIFDWGWANAYEKAWSELLSKISFLLYLLHRQPA
ncbi:MAG: hypothetical protein Ct9H300mP21_01770 [Pseudomonadota bacterium]|nr:MAG: hypothetical protein Ct9H300mP21_01770 [Pseudomonadota bacterium]